MKTFLLALFVLLSTNAGCCQLVEDHPLPGSGGVAIRAWTYRSGALLVKGELFTPSGVGKCSAVIFCHDGISGISREHRMASIRLARAGFVVFAPSYRGEDGSQGMVEIAKGEVDDVLAALPLLEKLERVDSHRIAVAGASHGALIGVLAASRSKELKAAVLAYGVMDIYRWWEYLKDAHKLGNDRITDRTYGYGPQARPEAFQMRNALAVVTKVDCPVLLLQGEKDDIVPPQQAREMKRAMDAAGKICELKIYPSCLHGFLVYAPYLHHGVEPAERRETESAWKEMIAFLQRTLK